MNYRRKGEWMECSLSDWKRLSDTSSLETSLAQSGGLQQTGDRMRLRLFPSEPLGFEPTWMEFDVLYEDDFCLVVSKPAGISVHPSEPGDTDTLANAVAFHYQVQGTEQAVRHVHRLDKETTGPVLYAKGKWALARLDAAMRTKAIGRTYVALAEGVFAKQFGILDGPIGKDRHHNQRRRVSPTGQAARTRYEVLEQFPNAALVRLELDTGRTHQIRVHLSHLGHPLIGDELYGGSSKLLQRQALHGEALTFPHPLTGELHRVDCPLPKDFAELLDKLSTKK